MNILLIASNVATTPYPVYPLGMGMVASALEAAGHRVTQFDFLQNEMSLDALAQSVRTCRPGLVGISIRNIDNVNMMDEQRYIMLVKDIVDRVRTVTDARIVLGGSAYSIMPEAVLEAVGADYGVVGEGERIMVEFAADAENGVFPAERIIRAAPQLSGSRIPGASYEPRMLSYYLQNANIVSVQTKRGCTHNCVYCSYPTLEGSSIRCREPREVVDDVELLVQEHGAKMIFFIDSVFNDDAGHYRDVLQEMKRRGVCVPWTAFIKPEQLDDETVLLMKDTGLKAVELGSDAPSDATLEGLGKSFRFRDVAACSDLFARHDIATAHYFMFGCPGETQASVHEGINNIVNLKKTVSFIFMGIRILPATALEAIAVRDGVIVPGQDLFDPVYYIAPGIDREWLERVLTAGFEPHRHCVFPPNALDSSVQFLRKMGYTGLLWDMLIPGSKRAARVRGADA